MATVTARRNRSGWNRIRQAFRPRARRIDRVLPRIHQSISQLRSLTDRDLRRCADELRAGRQQIPAVPLSVEQRCLAVGLVHEAVRRQVGLTYFDVQLQAGWALASHCVVEMATGEGKTIVTAIPAFVASLEQGATHVVTPNSYLAERDFNEVKPALESLGLQVALLPEQHDQAAKRQAYRSDIVYGTGYEYGFDYLRDQLILRDQRQLPLGQHFLRQLDGRIVSGPEVLQPTRPATVIDEIDSVLIDEAMTPLIISLPPGDSPDAPRVYHAARELADALQAGVDYQVVANQRQISLTASGSAAIHAWLKSTTGLKLSRPWKQYIQQSLHARYFLHRNVDYVVRDNRVQIVDQKTGRIFTERSWRAGLHQAVEAREGVPVSPEQASAARITRQRFYRLYDSLAGMTGTAAGAEREFKQFYGTPVITIPRNRPNRRIDLPDRFFVSGEAAVRAIVLETNHRRHRGQPVLVGTHSIQQSLMISEQLTCAGLPHELLNGIQDREEAELIARAGHAGAITVATNMAGRGTDIKPDAAALEAGGLHVIGAGRNRCRRVDRQLAGRSGRQGQPGSSQFIVAADDDLFVREESRIADSIRQHADSEGESRRDFADAVARLQNRLETQSFRQRQAMVQQDDWNASVMHSLTGRVTP